MDNFLVQGESTLTGLLLIVGAVLVGWFLQAILFRLGKRVAERTSSVIDNAFLHRLKGPARLLLPLIVIYFIMPFQDTYFSPRVLWVLNKGFSILMIISVAWLIIRFTYILEDFLLDKYRISTTDNLKARKIYTQTQLLKKIITVVIIILTIAAILMSFEKFRELGTGLLASAGLAGLVLGFAAQKTLSNLLAGFQIAISQPIRIDDVVIVEGEWGWIEEIALTYVVVRIWDLRRLVLPISYFIEHPFQNWTRTSANILGTVYLYVDYTIPIAEIRDELHQILSASQFWDGEVWRLHTTNATEKTVELRALMSAKDSSSAWELRCEVREKLIEFVRSTYPDALPKIRTQLEKSPDGMTGNANQS